MSSPGTVRTLSVYGVICLWVCLTGLIGVRGVYKVSFVFISLVGRQSVVLGRQSDHRRRMLGITQRVVATTHATPGKGKVSVVRATVIANRRVRRLSSALGTVFRRFNVGFFLQSTSGVLRTRYVLLVNAHRRTRKLGYNRYKCTAYSKHSRNIPYTLGDVSMNVTVNSTYTATTSLHMSAHIVFSTKLTTRHLR